MEEEMEEWAKAEDLKLLVLLLRELGGWDQAGFAAAAGMSTSSICHYETGKTVPPRRTVKRLAATVGLPMSFVEASLLPALKAARAMAVPFPEGDFAELEKPGAELVRALAGTARPALAAFLSTLEEREPWERLGPPVEEDRQQALDAWSRLEPCTSEERRYLVETCREYQTWALAERLCHASAEAASDRADRALELAELACRAAELAPGGEAWRSRLQGYALAYLANARRVAGNLPEADETFARAWELWKAGAEAGPGLLAEWRLLGLEASLHRDRRRFRQALDRLDQARAMALPEAAGRILVKKAATLDQMGEAALAIEAVHEAAPFVEGTGEPRLLFGLRFILAANLCHLGRYAEAESLLPEVRALAVALRKELDLVRVVWLDGKLAAGLGRPAEAAASFEQVRREFTAQEIAWDAALVTLDLAELYLKSGRNREVRDLAEEMIWIFSSQEIHREALAALRIFCEAARNEAATAALARKVGQYLYRAQHDPELRFESGMPPGG
ncbi:MAG TPA: helix-turn-helix domain-containing protein [Thermoanaerobaculia bacterium]|nr:helix-turn-helix domain-containing protein [Thermoanaerobaculia bacterium]